MRVGVVSPSSPTVYSLPSRTGRAISALSELLGGEVELVMASSEPVGYRAMSPKQTAAALHTLFSDPEVGLILSAIGGFNSNSILAHLDFDLLRANPTHICGYSDATALLLGICASAGQIVLHGPALLPQWGDPQGPFRESVQSFLHAIQNDESRLELQFSGRWVDPRLEWDEAGANSFHHKNQNRNAWRVLRPGVATGTLVGGNIETINMLVGTSYLPRLRGALVFLEATGTEAYLPRLERSITHLRDVGFFEHATGLIFGRCPDAAEVRGISLGEMLCDLFSDRSFPILADVDIGHTEPLLTLPVGGNATLHANPERPHIVVHGFTNNTRRTSELASKPC